MRSLCVMLLAGLGLWSCSSSQYLKQTPKLDTLFAQYWDEHAKFYPLDATQQGDHRYNHLLPNDQTAEHREALREYYQRYLGQLLTFDRRALSADEQVSYDIFKYEMDMQLEGLNDNGWMIPFQQFWGLPLTMGQLATGEHFQPFKTVQDYQNWLGRVKGFSAWTDSAIANFRAGIKNGVVLPRVLVKKMIPQLADMVVTDPTKSLFYGPIHKFPASFTEAEKETLTRAYVQAINTDVVPSYRKLRDFLQKEYLPKARASHGINAVKGGEAMYRYLVKYWTTTNALPKDIHATGLLEVQRIRKEMEQVKAQVGFKGSLSAFFKHLRTDPKLMPYQSAEEILQAFRDIQAKMQPQLSSMFGRTPKTPFEIRQTEAFRAASASAEYSQGAPDGSRPGIFYIPIIDAKTFNITSGMESLFLHEAIPGHHYQISLQQENAALPSFRRFAWYGAMGEGWALYTESLGKELGLYTDPYQYMGSLGDEMHRALRLVVDVAIHTGKMNRQQAIQYLLANEPIPEEAAVAEIERYMAIPGQALSYKTGSLKIWELRKRYQTKLGAGFKLADFHDELLKDGVLPLAVLEQKMERWSERTR